MDYKLIQKSPTVLKLLQTEYKKSRVSHAYLFYGNSKMIKKEMAEYFTLNLYCKNKNEEGFPCLECPDCKRILHHSHPNFFWISPVNKTIKKEAIEDLLHEFQKKSMVDGPRVYVIEDADKMNLSSSNSLLKFIEESPEGTHGILISDNINQIPSTILSRCEMVFFEEDSIPEIYEELKKEDIEDSLAWSIAHMSNSYDMAYKLSSDEVFLQTMNFTLEWMKSRLINKANFVYTLLQYESNFYQNPKALEYFISICYYYTLDILKCYDNVENITYPSQLETIKQIQSSRNREVIVKQLAMMTDYMRRLNYNLKIDLALHSIALSLF